MFYRVGLLAAVAIASFLPPPAFAATLLQDGDVVIITIAEGPLKGSYRHPYNAKKGIFGPTVVVGHTATSLTFRGRRDTCKITADGLVTCRKLAGGTWKLQ